MQITIKQLQNAINNELSRVKLREHSPNSGAPNGVKFNEY